MTLHHLPIALVQVLVVLTFRQARGDVYFVIPGTTEAQDFNASYNTLSYLANSTALQLNDSVFYFMPGTHLLQQVWSINNARNLTLSGLQLPTTAPEDEVIVDCMQSSNHSGISVTETQNVTVKNMQIVNCGRATGCDEQYDSSVYFDFCAEVMVSNVIIGSSHGNALYLKSCTNYIIMHSMFENSQRAGILIENCSLTETRVNSITLLGNKDCGMYINERSNPNAKHLQLNTITASNNSNADFCFHVCSVNASVKNLSIPVALLYNKSALLTSLPTFSYSSLTVATLTTWNLEFSCLLCRQPILT